jgi:electron transport complex protein RnfG
MPTIAKLALLLGIIAMAMAFALAEVNTLTAPEIARQQAEKTAAALARVLPEASTGKLKAVYGKDDKIDYYVGYADSSAHKLIGFAFEARKPGYSGDIVSIVGIDTLGVIKGIVITRHTETPGLGAKCTEEHPFDGQKYSLRQFIGATRDKLKVDKDGGEIVSITGATITTRVIANSVREKMDAVLSARKLED